MFWIRARVLWGAKRPKHRITSNWRLPMTVVVHHTADRGPTSNTVRAEKAFMRQTQEFHMGPSRGWSDIGYNYIIMPSGRVYEGRGYGVVGSHAPGLNTRGIGISFAGTYSEVPPTDAAVRAYKALRVKLTAKGANITATKGHGDVFPTSCPGPALRRRLGLG